MNKGFEQNAVDVMSQPAIQKSVATAMIGTGFATALDWIPDIIALMAGMAGLLVSITIIRKNRAETRKLNIQSDILESKELIRKKEMQARFERGDPCMRCTDKPEGIKVR
ncbi:hypothetical protein KAR91_70390 [Candidatus Pacearchaeota archaeon]|nr:hypothetical protein [Candidatus Pacearchaeota archaeon]